MPGWGHFSVLPVHLCSVEYGAMPSACTTSCKRQVACVDIGFIAVPPTTCAVPRTGLRIFLPKPNMSRP